MVRNILTFCTRIQTEILSVNAHARSMSTQNRLTLQILTGLSIGTWNLIRQDSEQGETLDAFILPTMTAEELRTRFPNAGEEFIALNSDNNFERMKKQEQSDLDYCIEKYPEYYPHRHPERDLHKLICNLLLRRGIKWFGHGSTAHRTKYTVGWPDFVIPLPNGKTLYWEVKTTTGPVTPEQDQCLKWLTLNGHRAYVIRGYPQALDLLNEQYPI